MQVLLSVLKFSPAKKGELDLIKSLLNEEILKLKNGDMI